MAGFSVSVALLQTCGRTHSPCLFRSPSRNRFYSLRYVRRCLLPVYRHRAEINTSVCTALRHVRMPRQQGLSDGSEKAAESAASSSPCDNTDDGSAAVHTDTTASLPKEPQRRGHKDGTVEMASEVGRVAEHLTVSPPSANPPTCNNQSQDDANQLPPKTASAAQLLRQGLQRSAARQHDCQQSEAMNTSEKLKLEPLLFTEVRTPLSSADMQTYMRMRVYALPYGMCVRLASRI